MGAPLHLNGTNFTNGTLGPVDPERIFGAQRDSLYIVVPVTIMYSMIFLTGLFGNLCTCLVIIRNQSMHTATNYYLFSLAISDLLLLISGMPQEMYSIWSKWPYVFGPAFCLIRGLAAETSSNASVLTITLFTVERYLAICHPFVSHKMSKLSRAKQHVVALWAVALLLALPQALQFGVRSHRGVTMCLQTRILVPHSFEMSTFFFFFTPMVLITILYSLIGLRLKKSDVSKDVPGQKETNINMRFTPQVQRKHSQSTKRVIKMLVAVVVAFFVCWAPFHAQRLVAIYGTDEYHKPRSSLLLNTYTVLTYISGVFYYFSTSINPILYHIMSNKFRDAFKNTVVRCCQTGARASQRSSYTTLPLGRNPASNSTSNSGKMPKDGASGGKGSLKGSQTSSSDKRINFNFDRNVIYYQHKYAQPNVLIHCDTGNDLNKLKEITEKAIPEDVYIVPAKKPEEDTQVSSVVTVSDEPEAYIKENQDRIKRRHKGYG